MKKSKALIFGIACFIMGISINVMANTLFRASEVEYTNSDSEVTNVDEALTELYNEYEKIIDFSKMERIWYPVPTTAASNSYEGTYVFNDSYRYVLEVNFTNMIARTVYSHSSDLNVVFFGAPSRNEERVEVRLFKDVKPGSSIYFKIVDLDRAGIGVWGIK